MHLDEIFGEWFVSWFLAWVGDSAYTPFRSEWSLLCFGLGEPIQDLLMISDLEGVPVFCIRPGMLGAFVSWVVYHYGTPPTWIRGCAYGLHCQDQHMLLVV